MIHILHALLSTPTPWGMGIPCIFTGPPGTGKTSTIRAYAKAIQRPLELISPGERGEAVLGAIPAVREGRVYYPVPDWTDHVGTNGIICLDEARTAPLVIRPALLGLLLDRRCGGWQAERGVSVVAFSNSTDDSPNGAPLEAAVTNRLVNLQWDSGSLETALTNMRSFLPGWDGVGYDLASPTAFDFDRAHRMVGNFLRKHPDCRQEKPRLDAPWASDRSWTLVACCLAAAKAFNLNDTDRQSLIDGCVGVQAGSKFQVAQTSELPDIQEILSGTSNWKADPSRPDEAKAVADAAAASGDKRAWRLIRDIMGAGNPDVIVPAFKEMLQNQKIETDEFTKEIALRLVPVVEGRKK